MDLLALDHYRERSGRCPVIRFTAFRTIDTAQSNPNLSVLDLHVEGVAIGDAYYPADVILGSVGRQRDGHHCRHKASRRKRNSELHQLAYSSDLE
jgi:hypothetical protein